MEQAAIFLLALRACASRQVCPIYHGVAWSVSPALQTDGTWHCRTVAGIAHSDDGR